MISRRPIVRVARCRLMDCSLAMWSSTVPACRDVKTACSAVPPFRCYRQISNRGLATSFSSHVRAMPQQHVLHRPATDRDPSTPGGHYGLRLGAAGTGSSLPIDSAESTGLVALTGVGSLATSGASAGMTLPVRPTGPADVGALNAGDQQRTQGGLTGMWSPNAT